MGAGNASARGLLLMGEEVVRGLRERIRRAVKAARMRMARKKTKKIGEQEEDSGGEETSLSHRTPLYGTAIHIGWITQQEGNSFILEKDFRALRTWLASSDLWPYNFEEIRRSLRLTPESPQQVYWFDDIELEPWVARDDSAIAGAVQRMYLQRGEVCFFVAEGIKVVRALSVKQRGLFDALAHRHGCLD